LGGTTYKDGERSKAEKNTLDWDHNTHDGVTYTEKVVLETRIPRERDSGGMYDGMAAICSL
jgi:hypothetical protein